MSLINAEEGLHFLAQHQPMPDDVELDEQTSKRYDEVRRWFEANPDSRCIPLFLNSFGYIDGFGVYVQVPQMLAKYSVDDVLPHLVAVLREGTTAGRYWASHVAMEFGDPRLMDCLEPLTESQDEDLRWASLTALCSIDDERVSGILKRRLELEDSEMIRTIVAGELNKRLDQS